MFLPISCIHFGVLLGLLVALASSVPAADGRSGLSSLAIFDPLADGWKNNGKLALMVNSTTVHDPSVSRDPTIAGSTTSAAGLATVDARAAYVVGADSLEHLISARYGRLRDSTSASFVENDDEIRYDGTYRHVLSAPHFLYSLAGFDSVFTGPSDPPDTTMDNARRPLDPFVARISAGYGQRYEQYMPDDFLEMRVGVRASRRWESQPLPGQEATQVGTEWYVRYEYVPKRFDKHLSCFVQYEGFSEFKDPAHTTHLITGSVTFQIDRYVQFQFAMRAYYESRPMDSGSSYQPGYDEWSFKQDVLAGLNWIF